MIVIHDHHLTIKSNLEIVERKIERERKGRGSFGSCNYEHAYLYKRMNMGEAMDFCWDMVKAQLNTANWRQGGRIFPSILSIRHISNNSCTKSGQKRKEEEVRKSVIIHDARRDDRNQRVTSERFELVRNNWTRDVWMGAGVSCVGVGSGQKVVVGGRMNQRVVGW